MSDHEFRIVFSKDGVRYNKGMPLTKVGDQCEPDEIQVGTAQILSHFASQGDIKEHYEARIFGQNLFQLLDRELNEDSRLTLGYKLKSARDAGKPLRFVLEFDLSAPLYETAQQLPYLPWEFLNIPQGGIKVAEDEYATHVTELNDHEVVVACDQEFVLSRRIKRGKDGFTASGEIRVLLIVSDPGLDPDAGTVDHRPVREVLLEESSHEIGSVERAEAERGPAGETGVLVLFNPTRPALKKAAEVKRGWDIVHYIGHGAFTQTFQGHGDSRLMLAKENGEPDHIDVDDFQQLLAGGGSSRTRLIVLQACESGAGSKDFLRGFQGFAVNLARKFPNVVAMQYPVGNNTSNEFARAFYQSLRQHNPVDHAVQDGRIALRSWTAEQSDEKILPREYASPVVYTDGTTTIFYPPPAEAPELPDDQPTATDSKQQPDLAAGPQPQAEPPDDHTESDDAGYSRRRADREPMEHEPVRPAGPGTSVFGLRSRERDGS